MSISNKNLVLDIIKNCEWLSSTYPHVEKIKNSIGILEFVNESESKYFFVVSGQKLFIPDAAIYNIKCNSENSPLALMWTKNEFTSAASYDFGEHDLSPILMTIIILTSGDLLAFSFIDPFYVPEIYRFIDAFIPQLERYLNVIINRIIASILNTNGSILKTDAIKALLLIHNVVPEDRYQLLKQAVGYAVWCRPLIAKEILADFEMPTIGICYKNVAWSDVYATFLVIKYGPEEEIKKLDAMRHD